MLFSDLNLSDTLIASMPPQCHTPTKIQALAIPKILEGKDLLAIAQTGSGKTLAFGLPVLEAIHQKAITGVSSSPKALILVPTRELATQVEQAILTTCHALNLRSLLVCGGIDKAQQVEALTHAPDVLIATPGRVLDLLNAGAIDTTQLNHVVLDEADRLLDMGFWPDVEKILAHLPPKRQTMMFSATSPDALGARVQQVLTQPVIVKANTANSVVDKIEERLYLVNKGSKANVLISQIKQGGWKQVLVFIGARDNADAMCKKLNKAGILAAALHGNKDQNEREQTLEQFKQGDIHVLIATDLLARGIHVDSLPVVINAELPANPAVYVHRVGRTARAGAQGVAISLVCHGEADYLAAIRDLTQRELALQTLEEFPVTDKPSTGQSKRAPRDKKANRRTNNKKSIKQFKSKPKPHTK